jgi:ArsR family transcriptional regulator, arsenate/arsenite/antimonite-responsive transcriptional repressor
VTPHCQSRGHLVQKSSSPRLLTGVRWFYTYLTVNTGPTTEQVLSPGQFERIAKALADPRRVEVLQTIAATKQECAYQRICRQIPLTKATISHHLKELVQAGLVETVRTGQYVQTHIRPGVIEAYAAELVRRTGGGAG